jgi:hypothetical protein
MIHESKYLIERRKRMLGIKPPEEKKKPKPISIKSVKRKVEEKLYLKKKKEYLTKHIRCEVKGCNHVSEDVHHKKGREGKLLYDERFFMAVCRDHHTQIEGDPVWAKENGYSIDKHKI